MTPRAPATHRVALDAMGRGARWVRRAALGEVVEVVDAGDLPVAYILPALLPLTREIVEAWLERHPISDSALAASVRADLLGMIGTAWRFRPADEAFVWDGSGGP